MGRLVSGEERPPSPEEVDQVFEEGMNGFVYGPGLGRTALNITGIVLFPPYALYLLGKAGVALAGYGSVSASDALPQGPKEFVDEAYDSVTSVPGRVMSIVAGEEYRKELSDQVAPNK